MLSMRALLLVFLLRPYYSVSLDISSYIPVVGQALPALPFVPFFPVTAADFLPRDTPSTYLLQHKLTSGIKKNEKKQPILVCVGDSITHGSVSADWVSSLSKNLTLVMPHRVLNAGKNSETAAAVRMRLEEIIAVRPAAVTIMIGTNDLIGTLDEAAGSMYQVKLWWAQKTVPSLEAYANELEKIVSELDTRLEEYGTRIAVLSPPPLGEGGPDSHAWKLGAQMAQICSDVCMKKSSERVTYIPLYEQIKKEMIHALPSETKLHRDFVFRDAIPLTSVVVPWQLLVQRQSFSQIQQTNGYKYTIDSVHFGQEFATSVEKFVYEWIIALKSRPQKS